MKRSIVVSQLLDVKAISITIFLMLCIFLYPAKSLNFQYSFSDGYTENITIVKQDSWYNGSNTPFLQDSAIWLTTNPEKLQNNVKNSLGQVRFKDPVQFMPSNQSNLPKKVTSFNTSFTFQIITTSAYDLGGNGMAFFISNFDKAPKASDDFFLGLANTSANATIFFAVEFDTHLSPTVNDSSGSHIGIDINSLVSLNHTDTRLNSSYPELYLYKNSTFTAWIEYDSSSHLIQVWMALNSTSSQRPPQPCLQLAFNLSDVFQDFMYVGFSASNEAGVNVSMEGHALYSWNFSSVDPEPQGKRQSKTTWKALVSVAGVLIVLGVFGIALFCILKKRRNTIILGSHNKRSIELAPSTPGSLPRYSYKELRRAAHGFTDQNQVGEGGYSRVYKATLADGSIVAIKKLKDSFRKEAEFATEINIISSIRHRNLLQLRGWCCEKGEALLVYKYMSNGSLESYLYGEKRGTLESEIRLRVLAGVASALEYLHTGLGECVLHRDVKAANVLLTQNFEPMMSDFGLARLIAHNGLAVTMTAVGTPGYVAPEVVYTGRATDKADVYSFGILALEMASGRPAIYRSTQPGEYEVRLLDWVWLLHQSNQLMEALDLSMGTDIPPAQIKQWRCVLHVSLMCCDPTPEARPTMRQVSQALQGDTLLLMQPLPATRPMFPTDRQSTSGSSTSGITGSSHMYSQAEGSSGPPSNSNDILQC